MSLDQKPRHSTTEKRVSNPSRERIFFAKCRRFAIRAPRQSLVLDPESDRVVAFNVENLETRQIKNDAVRRGHLELL